jgi:hypothetical protein
MALKIVEFFGFDPADRSQEANEARRSFGCPSLGDACTKTLREEDDGTEVISGACTVRQVEDPSPIICCPRRLYANGYQALREVAATVFEGKLPFFFFGQRQPKVRRVIAIGKDFGGEVRLPGVRGLGSFFVDWILAVVDQSGKLEQFVAVEVQSIDTTGNYRAERLAYLKRQECERNSPGGINWENVNKRILPQLIFKGHVLRLEPLCRAGLFFICPVPVLARIRQRVGNALRPYPNFHPGTLTFRSYDIGPPVPQGQPRSLVFREQLTTTVDQLAIAFTAPINLPPQGAYAQAIAKKLQNT